MTGKLSDLNPVNLPWNRKGAEALEPFNDLVILGLVGIITVTFLVLVSGDRWTRALWLAYIMLP